jgi:hypothetical protein
MISRHLQRTSRTSVSRCRSCPSSVNLSLCARTRARIRIPRDAAHRKRHVPTEAEAFTGVAAWHKEVRGPTSRSAMLSVHGHRCARLTEVLDLFFPQSGLNVYAGEREVRPPAAPTIWAGSDAERPPSAKPWRLLRSSRLTGVPKTCASGER